MYFFPSGKGVNEDLWLGLKRMSGTTYRWTRDGSTVDETTLPWDPSASKGYSILRSSLGIQEPCVEKLNV